MTHIAGLKMLMARNQANVIADSIDKNMLEWGSGGTTIYLLQRLVEGQHLTSVEHHPQWADKVWTTALRVLTEEQMNRWTYRRIEGKHVGENATPFEENPAGLRDYIGAEKLDDFDTILVDGVARAACLARTRQDAWDADIFLHDAERTWYRWAQDLFDDGEEIEAAKGEYPPLLWRTAIGRNP
jgi:hypothetical protein